MRAQPMESVRHLLCHLEKGESVMASLRKVARDHGVVDAWVQGTGSFEWVEVAASSDAAGTRGPTRRFDSPCDVPSLTGRLSTSDGEPVLELAVVLSRETDNGVEVLGGHLVAARVASLQLWLSCFEEGAPSEPRRGPPADRAPAPPTPTTPTAPPAGSSGVSWAMAAEVSAQVAELAAPERRAARPSAEGGEPGRGPAPLPERARPEPATMDELAIGVGDWVDHQSFGLCRVDRVDDDDGLLIKLPNGRRKLIKITYLEVQSPRQDGPRRVFPLRPRRPT